MKKNKIKPWWERCKFPNMGENSYDRYYAGWADTGIYKMALDCREPVIIFSISGHIAPNTDSDSVPTALTQEIINIGCAQIVKYDNAEIGVFINDNSAIKIICHVPSDSISIDCLTLDQTLVDKLKNICDKYVIKKGSSKNMYVLAQTSFGLSTIALGKVHTSIQEDNYSKEVMDDIKYSISEFNKKSPKGRLLILNGPPGTGKTYLVKGLSSAIENGIFVVLPSDLASQIAGPQLIPSFLSIKKDCPNVPLYLIIEDADQCLVARGSDNLGYISSILNLADGIVGESLDIRIIATTNAKKLDIDSAIKRPGRLCKQVDVGLLSASEASAVYKRLTGNQISSDVVENVSLAEVYNMSSPDNIAKVGPGIVTKQKKQEKRIGFVNRSDE